MIRATPNRVGALVIAVCIPVLGLLLVLLPQGDLTGRYADQVAVPADGDVVRDGLRIRVRGDGEFGTAQGLTTPEGTALVAVAVQLTPADRSALPSFCEVTLSAPGGGDRRTWQQDGDAESYGYQRSDTFAEICEARPVAATTVEAVFLTPAGTRRIASLDVTLTKGGRQTLVRLALPAPVSD